VFISYMGVFRGGPWHAAGAGLHYGPILHRFWDTATYWLKIAYFCYPSGPLSFGALVPYVPFGILHEVNRQETRVMGPAILQWRLKTPLS